MGHSSSHHSADITSVPGHHKKKKKHQKPDSGPESEGSVDSDASSDKDSSSTEKEVMISYSRKDAEAITILRAALRREGISTWCDVQDLKVGDDFLSKIGQAVIDCKIFVFLASSSSIQSKYCQDELALAYISNKPIYPVALESSDELFDKMDTGMRLQLARFDWSFFLEPSEYEENFNKLLVKLKDDLVKSGNARVSLLTESMEDLGEFSEMNISDKRKLLQRSSSKPAMRVDIKRDISFPGSGDDETDDAFLFSFWERHFGDAQNVPWFEFVKEFSVEYNKQIDHIFREEKDKVWLISILHRELDVTSNKLERNKYDRFCSTDTGQKTPFWIKVQDQAVESYTIREVFNMESSVRVDAIENLGKFKSPAVIEALIDLLLDEDNNVRAVAAISLARTGSRTVRIIDEMMNTLDSKDRLVRESGCLALGHLKVEDAVPKLVQLWRNDFISSVREAASLALEQIGGELANEAIRMTKLLSEEIHMLTKS